MGGITEAEIAAAIGPVEQIVMQEIVRTGASDLELRRALSMARGRADLTADSALPPHMQRLVELLAVTLPEQGPPRPLHNRTRNSWRVA